MVFPRKKKKPNELILFHAPRMTSIAVAVATPCWRAEIEPSTENNFILFYFKFLLFSSPFLYDSDVGRVMTYTLENLKRKKSPITSFLIFERDMRVCAVHCCRWHDARLFKCCERARFSPTLSQKYMFLIFYFSNFELLKNSSGINENIKMRFEDAERWSQSAAAAWSIKRTFDYFCLFKWKEFVPN